MTEDISTKKTDIQKTKSNKIIKTLCIIVGILVIISVLAFVWLFYVNKDVVAKVGSDKITKQDLNKAIYSEDFKGTVQNPTAVSKDREKEIVNKLVDDQIIMDEASKLGITVSDEDVNAINSDRNIDYNNFTAEQKEISKANLKTELVRDKFNNQAFGWKEGDFLLFRFDKYLEGGSQTFTGKGDQALVANQKSYAKALADSVYSKLQSKEIDFNAAQSLLATDPQVGAVAQEPKTPNLSSSFSKNSYLRSTGMFDVVTYPGFKNKVSTLTKENLTEPFVLQESFEGKNRDISYAIVIIRDGNAGTIQGNFDSWLAQKRTDLSVRIYASGAPFYQKISIVSKAFALPSCSRDTSTTQSPGTGELTNLNVDTKYKKADGSIAPITSSMGLTFMMKSRNWVKSGYDQSQHSFIDRPNPGLTSRNLCNLPMDRNDGLFNMQSSGGTNFRINCGYVKYFDLYYSDPTITKAQANGTWTITNAASTGDKRWIDDDQSASDNQILIRTFCYLNAKNGSCTGNSSNGSIHYPNGELIDFGMLYTPSYCSPANGANGANGTCGTANGTTVSTAPTSGFCNAGSPSRVAGSGPWTWTCSGTNGTAGTCGGSNGTNGTSASCSATKCTPVNGTNGTNGVCGSANGTTASTVPTSGFCNAGSPSSVAGSGPWTWTCSGTNGTAGACGGSNGTNGTSASCSVQKTGCTPVVNGSCGSANNTTVTTKPTSSLCSDGATPTVSGTGPWTWTCPGNSCGTSAGCSAQKPGVTTCTAGRDLNLTADKTTITSGDTINFNLASTSMNFSTMNFGDNNSVVLPPNITSTMAHNYTNTTTGNLIFTVTLAAKDIGYPNDASCALSKSVNITVAPAGTPPPSTTCAISLQANNFNPLTLPSGGGGVVFTGTGSNVNDYTLSYPSSLFTDTHVSGVLTAASTTIGNTKNYNNSAIPILTGHFYEGAMKIERATCQSPVIIIVPAVKALNCVVEPTSGKSPLAVHVRTLSSGLSDSNYQFNMKDTTAGGWNTWQTKVGGDFYYTFKYDLSNKGHYQPAVKHSDYLSGQEVPCNAGNGVTVPLPTDSHGTETAPGN